MQPIELTMTIFLLVIVIAFVFYTVPRLGVIYIKLVSAGSTKYDDAVKDKVIGQLSKEDFSYYEAMNIKPYNYSFMVVIGNCMSPKQICKGDIVLIEKFPFFVNNKQKKKKIKQGDILLIDFTDENSSQQRIKLREFVSFSGENAMTRYYSGDHPQESSRPHKLKNIRGIVRYVDHKFNNCC